MSAAPPFTIDDVIDFHFLLLDDRWIEECLAEPPSHRDASGSEEASLYYGASVFYRRMPDSEWMAWATGQRSDAAHSLALARRAVALEGNRVRYRLELGAALSAMARAAGTRRASRRAAAGSPMRRRVAAATRSARASSPPCRPRTGVRPRSTTWWRRADQRARACGAAGSGSSSASTSHQRLTKRYREDVLILIGCVMMTVSLIGWALTPNVIWLLIVLAPTAISGGILNTLLSSTLTKAVQPQEIGGILGLGASIESATRIFAPIIGGYLLQTFGTWSPGTFGAVLMLGITIFIFFNVYNHPIAAEIRGRSAQQPIPAPNGD